MFWTRSLYGRYNKKIVFQGRLGATGADRLGRGATVHKRLGTAALEGPRSVKDWIACLVGQSFAPLTSGFSVFSVHVV